MCAGLCLNSQEYQALRINARVDSRCKLELSSNSMSFSRYSSFTAGLIAQNEAPLQVTVKTTTGPGECVYLRIAATGNLVDSNTGQTIDAESISWKATGTGFRDGSLKKGVAQKVGQWNKSGVWKGTLTFSFQDKQDYAPGTYILVVSMSASTF